MVEGGARPAPDGEIEAARQLRQRLRNARLLARSFAHAGVLAVDDDIIIGRRMEHLLEELADVPCSFVMLTPSLEAVREREAGRGTALHHAWGWMDTEIRERTKRIGLWLDTTHETLAETVAAIVRRRAEARGPGGEA